MCSDQPLHVEVVGTTIPRGEWARAFAAGLLVLSVLFAPALLGDGQFAFRDNGRMHLPVKRWIAGELGRGHLPEWNPYAGLGAPVVAGAVDAVQHPFNAFLVLLPFDTGFKAWVLLAYLLAFLGAFAWARQLAGSLTAGLAGALAFALSGFLVSSSDNVCYLTALAAVPWMLAAGLRVAERMTPGTLGALGLASALCAAAGDPQSWGLAVLAVPVQAMALAPPDGRGMAWRRGLYGTAACLVGAAPFVLPVLAWMPASSRTGALDWAEHQRWNLHPIRLAELALPGLLHGRPGELYSAVFDHYAGNAPTTVPWVLSEYLGVSVLALACLGAATSRRARRLLLVAGLLCWIAMGHYAGFGQLAHHLPLLSGLRYWEKISGWLPLLVGGAAALGTARLMNSSPLPSAFVRVTAIAAAATSLAGIAALLYPAALADALGGGEAARQFAENLATALLHAGAVALAFTALGFARTRRPTTRWISHLAVALVALDLMAAGVGAYVLSPPEVARPPSALGTHLANQPGLRRIVTPFRLTPDRWPELGQFGSLWRWGAQTLDPAWNVPHRIGNLETYSGMVPARTARFRTLAGSARVLPSAGLWSITDVVVPKEPALAATVGLLPPYIVGWSDLSLPLHLVSVPHRERAYLARRLQRSTEEEALSFALAPGSMAGEVTVVEGQPPGDGTPPNGEARVVRDEPESVEVQVETDRPGLLVLNDTFAPGWSARLDGRLVDILAANYLARGVLVDQGRHIVSFRYRTPFWREGWVVFALGAIGIIGWSMYRRRIAS